MSYTASAPQPPLGSGTALPVRQSAAGKRSDPPDDAPNDQRLHFKPPKRKRLPKACDPCHKSKRRCDGTAPCGNCYFAAKDCTYTDSTGRPVPAPNAARPGAAAPQPLGNNQGLAVTIPGGEVAGSYAPRENPLVQVETQHLPTKLALQSGIAGPSHFGSPTGASFAHQPIDTKSRSTRPYADVPLSTSSVPRKRQRGESVTSGSNPAYAAQEQIPTPVSAPGATLRSNAPATGKNQSHAQRLDPSGHLTHQLVNLFFAHCHPYRMVFRSTTFFHDLYNNRVPSYLIDAVCALAAPLCKHPLLCGGSKREAGMQFAEAAISTLFDGKDEPVADGVEAAQALVLIQAYNILSKCNMAGNLAYFAQAFRILHPILNSSSLDSTPSMSQLSTEDRRTRALEREYARRTFWLIHMLELLGAIFTRRTTTYSHDDLSSFSLPCDEASFDLATFPTSPDEIEYLDTPALMTHRTSEIGHVLRIGSILLAIEHNNNVDSPDPRAIATCEERLENWVHGLAPHLKYTDETLQYHLSMWETNANSSMWCFALIHILHSCAVLALSDIRRRLRQEPHHDHQNAVDVVPTVMNAIGPRARNSILMGSVLWLQYCGPHAHTSLSGNGISSRSPGANQSPNPQTFESDSLVQEWLQQWEELWGPHHNKPRSEAHRYHVTVRSPMSPSTRMGMRTSDLQAHAGTTAGWTVPDVVIDPVLHVNDEVLESASQPLASPALSTTSTLRGRDQPSLPSLKASGLLDVSVDEAGRLSRASTPSKPAPPWPLSTNASPRAPLLSPGHSPGLSVPSPSGALAGTPLPSLPSPGPSQLHMPAEIYPRGSPLPSPGFLAAPSSFPEGGSAVQVSRHIQQEQAYYEPSSSSPHGHVAASHGADTPPARR